MTLRAFTICKMASCHACKQSQTALNICGHCQYAMYCNASCQEKHWNEHHFMYCDVIGKASAIVDQRSSVFEQRQTRSKQTTTNSFEEELKAIFHSKAFLQVETSLPTVIQNKLDALPDKYMKESIKLAIMQQRSAVKFNMIGQKLLRKLLVYKQVDPIMINLLFEKLNKASGAWNAILQQGVSKQEKERLQNILADENMAVFHMITKYIPLQKPIEYTKEDMLKDLIVNVVSARADAGLKFDAEEPQRSFIGGNGGSRGTVKEEEDDDEEEEEEESENPYMDGMDAIYDNVFNGTFEEIRQGRVLTQRQEAEAMRFAQVRAQQYMRDFQAKTERDFERFGRQETMKRDTSAMQKTIRMFTKTKWYTGSIINKALLQLSIDSKPKKVLFSVASALGITGSLAYMYSENVLGMVMSSQQVVQPLLDFLTTSLYQFKSINATMTDLVQKQEEAKALVVQNLEDMNVFKQIQGNLTAVDFNEQELIIGSKLNWITTGTPHLVMQNVTDLLNNSVVQKHFGPALYTDTLVDQVAVICREVEAGIRTSLGKTSTEPLEEQDYAYLTPILNLLTDLKAGKDPYKDVEIAKAILRLDGVISSYMKIYGDKTMKFLRMHNAALLDKVNEINQRYNEHAKEIGYSIEKLEALVREQTVALENAKEHLPPLVKERFKSQLNRPGETFEDAAIRTAVETLISPDLGSDVATRITSQLYKNPQARMFLEEYAGTLFNGMEVAKWMSLTGVNLGIGCTSFSLFFALVKYAGIALAATSEQFEMLAERLAKKCLNIHANSMGNIFELVARKTIPEEKFISPSLFYMCAFTSKIAGLSKMACTGIAFGSHFVQKQIIAIIVAMIGGGILASLTNLLAGTIVATQPSPWISLTQSILQTDISQSAIVFVCTAVIYILIAKSMLHPMRISDLFGFSKNYRDLLPPSALQGVTSVVFNTPALASAYRNREKFMSVFSALQQFGKFAAAASLAPLQWMGMMQKISSQVSCFDPKCKACRRNHLKIKF